MSRDLETKKGDGIKENERRPRSIRDDNDLDMVRDESRQRIEQILAEKKARQKK